MNHEYTRLEAETKCSRCGGTLYVGEKVRVFWSVKLDGWVHSHIGRIGCKRNRVTDEEVE